MKCKAAYFIVVLFAGLLVSTARGGSGDLLDLDRLWDYEHPDSTEQRFKALLPEALASGDASFLAELWTQIARTQGLQQRFEEAQATLDHAENLLYTDLKRARIRYLLERGRVFNSSKQPDRSRPLFLTAWELAREAGEDFLAVDAAHMMGIIEPADSALVWNDRAIQYAEQSTQPKARRWLGSLYNNLGWTYHDRGEYEAALTTFQKAFAWREEQGQERETRIARWCVARTLRSLGRTKEALAIQREILGELTTIGETDGFVHEELAECLRTLGDEEAAREQFALAYRELSADPWLTENEPDRIARLKQLGGLSDSGEGTK